NYSSVETPETPPTAAAEDRGPGGGGLGWDPRYASALTVHGVEEPEVLFEDKPEIQEPKKFKIENITPGEVPIVVEEEPEEKIPYVFEELPAKVTYKYWWFWIIVLIIVGLVIHRMTHYAETHHKKLPIPQLRLPALRKLKLRTKPKLRSKVKKRAVKKKVAKKPKVKKKLKKVKKLKKIKKIKKKPKVKPKKEEFSRKDVDKLLRDVDRLLKNV
ncbi:MAG: hypothetical protein KAT43_06785, partial [Nanoarchaeota archaeon]|nr:hypothetical protein [Nanoarchaeota archaeon]